MTPWPVRVLARLTLLPGEPSASSTEGIESPTLTMLAKVGWKKRLVGAEYEGRTGLAKQARVVDEAKQRAKDMEEEEGQAVEGRRIKYESQGSKAEGRWGFRVSGCQGDKPSMPSGIHRQPE